jgi:hypothetical protein
MLNFTTVSRVFFGHKRGKYLSSENERAYVISVDEVNAGRRLRKNLCGGRGRGIEDV